MWIPSTKVADVVEAIRTHQPHLRPVTLEGTILRDADILEQLGAIGILRVVAKIRRDTRYPTFTAAAATLRKSLADLPGKLQMDSAKALAQPRIALLEAFLQELNNEAQDALSKTGSFAEVAPQWLPMMFRGTYGGGLTMRD